MRPNKNSPEFAEFIETSAHTIEQLGDDTRALIDEALDDGDLAEFFKIITDQQDSPNDTN